MNDNLRVNNLVYSREKSKNKMEESNDDYKSALIITKCQFKNNLIDDEDIKSKKKKDIIHKKLNKSIILEIEENMINTNKTKHITDIIKHRTK